MFGRPLLGLHYGIFYPCIMARAMVFVMLPVLLLAALRDCWVQLWEVAARCAALLDQCNQKDKMSSSLGCILPLFALNLPS